MTSSLSYSNHRFPPEIISHAVWLYFRFTLSFRDVEELLASRGILVTYETLRQWCLKFGQTYANALRRRQPLEPGVVGHGSAHQSLLPSRAREDAAQGRDHRGHAQGTAEPA